MLAPTFSNLIASGTNTGATSFNTASISPTGNRLILVVINAYRSSGSAQPPTPTVTGNGITYSLVQAQDVDTVGVDRTTMFVFRGMAASPTSGAVTIDFSGTTIDKIAWVVDQSNQNVDKTGSNGSGAIVSANVVGSISSTTVTTQPTSFAQTMGSGNSGYFACATQTSSNAQTPRTNWTELADVTTITTAGLETQYIAGTDTAGSSSWTTATRAGSVVIEVAAAPGPNKMGFDGGTAGNTITTSNAAGTGDAQFSSVTIGTNCTATFYDAGPADNLGGAFASTSTSTTSRARQDLGWGTTTLPVSERWKGSFSVIPGVNTSFMTLHDSGTNLIGSVRLTTAGKIQIANKSASQVSLSTTVISAGQVFAVDFKLITRSATVGQFEARIYTTNPNGTSPDETLTSSANVDTSTTNNDTRYGDCGICTNNTSLTVNVCDFQVAQSDYVGPYLLAQTATQAVTASGSSDGAAQGTSTQTVTASGSATGATQYSGTADQTVTASTSASGAVTGTADQSVTATTSADGMATGMADLTVTVNFTATGTASSSASADQEVTAVPSAEGAGMAGATTQTVAVSSSSAGSGAGAATQAATASSSSAGEAAGTASQTVTASTSAGGHVSTGATADLIVTIGTSATGTMNATGTASQTVTAAGSGTGQGTATAAQTATAASSATGAVQYGNTATQAVTVATTAIGEGGGFGSITVTATTSAAGVLILSETADQTVTVATISEGSAGGDTTLTVTASTSAAGALFYPDSASLTVTVVTTATGVAYVPRDLILVDTMGGPRFRDAVDGPRFTDVITEEPL